MRIAHDIHQHGHAARQMPENMAMEQPHARIVRPKAKNGVPTPGDLHGVSQSDSGEVVRIGGVAVPMTAADGVNAGRKGIFEGVVGSPTGGGFMDCDNVEVVTVLLGGLV
jgi:hypothetical protein